jgi:cell division protein FtsI (penicillin-binding protein 3)
MPVGPGRSGRRGRRPARGGRFGRRGGNQRLRIVSVRILLVATLLAAGVKLIEVQVLEAEARSAKGLRQRIERIDIPAARGDIVDRNGIKLAFSVESRALGWRPKAMRAQFGPEFDARTARLAAELRRVIGDRVNEREMVDRLRSDLKFTYLLDDVEPAQEREIRKNFPEVIAETRASRQYPAGTLASNIVGYANWREEAQDVRKHNLHGLSGLEIFKDNELSGTSGSQVVETEEGSDGVIIPGTERDLQPAKPGSSLELTIDADLQFDLQRKLAAYVAAVRARGGSAVIMDARTGEVYALANDKSFDPSVRTGFRLEDMGNPAVTTPYEPGSVNKVVTAAAAIEYGVTTPEATHRAADSMRIADRTVRDAWDHPPLNFTTTGVFAKSSNVGTLQLAQQVGADRYADLLRRFGLGERTGVGLPGESPGFVPERGQWSGSTFGNLPIGQGLSMTVLQMAGMYQAIANDGLRVPPRIIKAVLKPDGTRQEEPRPAGVRVVSEPTARTVKDMLRAVVQKAPGQNSGTGPAGALTGYQVSGKTGTAQQVDPVLRQYSDTKYWITFAGILPADDPRFVVGIVLDQPDYYGSPNGTTAAPLFHDIASFLAQRYAIPLSEQPSPIMQLVL